MDEPERCPWCGCMAPSEQIENYLPRDYCHHERLDDGLEELDDGRDFTAPYEP